MGSAVGKTFAAVTVILGLAPAAASAATIAPDVFGDELTNNANCSLREAIAIANADSNATEPDCAVSGTLGDDLIELHEEGTYRLELDGLDNTNVAGDLDVDTTNGDLQIDGLGAAQTRIDTDDTPNWDDRVLTQTAGSGSLTLSFLTITGGEPDGDGGGILSSTGSLVVQFTRVIGNRSDAGGGGIRAIGDSVSILDSTIAGNTAGSDGSGGGGVSFFTDTATIDSSAITGNSITDTGAAGGGILAGGGFDALTTITDSVVADNTAQSTNSSTPLGGGIAVTSGDVTIDGTTVSGNQVLGGTNRIGGGIDVGSPGNSTVVVNSTVSGNHADGAGGSAAGLSMTVGTATLVQTTFGPNTAGVSPSAIGRFAGSLSIRGSVVETSGALSGCLGTMTSQGFNVFTDSSCGALATGDEANADPLLGPLSNNGGPGAGATGFGQPMLTHLPAGSSTVIDHVPAADCDDELLAPLLFDQRGQTRPFESDGDGVAECEAGSVESHVAPAAPQGGGPTPATPDPTLPKKCKKGQKLKKGKCVKKKKRKK